MNAGDDILVNANIATTNGTITLIANHPGGTQANTGTFGVFTMADSTIIDAGGADINISAQGHVTVHQLTTTGTGQGGVQSTQGSILAASGTNSISGAIVSLGSSPGAGQSVGTSANPIRIDTTTPTALVGRAGTGGFFINQINTGAVLINEIGIIGAGDVSIIAGGAITAPAEGTAEITTTGNVTLQAASIGAPGNAVEFTSSAGGSGILDLTATSGVIDVIELTNKTFDTINLTVTKADIGSDGGTTTHSVVLVGDTDITIDGDGTNVALGRGDIDLSTNNRNFGLTVSNGGIALANGAINTGSGDVTLAGNTAISADADESAAEITSTGNVTLQGTQIGAAGNAVVFTSPAGGSGILDLTATSGVIDVIELTNKTFDTINLTVTKADIGSDGGTTTHSVVLVGDTDITIDGDGQTLRLPVVTSTCLPTTVTLRSP